MKSVRIASPHFSFFCIFVTDQIVVTMHRLAIFASGNGTNAQQIISHFQTHPAISVALVLSNNPGAGVLGRARQSGIPVNIFTRAGLYETGEVLTLLQKETITFVVLAGFLWLVPVDLLTAFPGKVINLHPALLPKYGGKGMYGSRVHETVLANREKESGITIHYVNEKFDEGTIIFQARCSVSQEDNPETLAQKIHQLEHRHLPVVIEQILTGKPVTGMGPIQA